VLLSPRSSFLIKDSNDHNVAPSPPINQAQMDPPMSRQDLAVGNPLKRLNVLTRQVSNLKRHLKTLEEEYEQLSGYKPSHADKLNNKEMRKCLLQLTKAKRDLKREFIALLWYCCLYTFHWISDCFDCGVIVCSESCLQILYTTYLG